MSAIDRLKENNDRAKINAWLDHIKEFDQSCRDEILEQCSKNIEARKYFIQRYAEDCK